LPSVSRSRSRSHVYLRRRLISTSEFVRCLLYLCHTESQVTSTHIHQSTHICPHSPPQTHIHVLTYPYPPTHSTTHTHNYPHSPPQTHIQTPVYPHSQPHTRIYIPVSAALHRSSALRIAFQLSCRLIRNALSCLATLFSTLPFFLSFFLFSIARSTFSSSTHRYCAFPRIERQRILKQRDATQRVCYSFDTEIPYKRERAGLRTPTRRREDRTS
jgi:hypothetical protein